MERFLRPRSQGALGNEARFLMVPLIRLICWLFEPCAAMAAFLRNILQPCTSVAERGPLPAAQPGLRPGIKRHKNGTRRTQGERQRH